MLGKRGPQRGLFEADTLYADFVGRDTFYGWLAAQRGELFPDELFLGLYIDGWGRPSVPPSVLATALVLQTYDGVSDDEATRRAAYDLQWKVALGVAVDTKPFAKSTLQEFRAQLVVHEEQRLLFQESLELAKRRGTLVRQRRLKVALDTTPILGRGAVKDTYNLLADGIVAVLRVLAQQAGVPRRNGSAFATWATAQGYGRYVADVSLKGGVAIDWNDPAARERFLGEIVADADRVLEQVRVARGALVAGTAEDTVLATAAGLLSRVLCQDVERKETGPAIRQGTAPDRVVSVHDPEMRHPGPGRKSARTRFDGHKGALAVDTDAQLITAVDVLAGNAPDDEDALELVDQTEQATGCGVDETYGDCAYGSGETRQAFAAAGRTLHAKVPVLTNRGRFPKTAFTIDLAAPGGGTCTCPGGHTTVDLRHTSGGQSGFFFPAATCVACPLRAQCVHNVAGHGGRTVALHPQEALLQQARVFQASDAVDAVRRRRQTVEHRIARLVQLGIRQARSVGHARTLFQLAMAATVANLTLLAAADATHPTLAAATAVVAVLLTALVFARSAHLVSLVARRCPTRGSRGWGHTPTASALTALTSRQLAGCRLTF
jgi:hypothetical protein